MLVQADPGRLKYSSRKLQTIGLVGSESSPVGGGATVGEPPCATAIAVTKRTGIVARTNALVASIAFLNKCLPVIAHILAVREYQVVLSELLGIERGNA